MSRSTKTPLLDYFDQAASRYADIEPAFGPLVDELVGLAAPQVHERVLDAGTGSGLAARRCMALCRMVCGLDFSRQMLRAAGELGLNSLLQSDMDSIPLRSATFDVVLASFALNSTDPVRALAELCRVLVPGGRLAIQEWGAPDPLSELVADTIASYAVDDPPPLLAAMRSTMQIPVPWDEIDGPDDIAELVKDAGFVDVEMKVERSPVRLPGVGAFIRYKLAWPNLRTEVEALSAETRQLCLSDLQENLVAHAEVDGRLSWQPEVIRIRARKLPA